MHPVFMKEKGIITITSDCLTMAYKTQFSWASDGNLRSSQKTVLDSWSTTPPQREHMLNMPCEGDIDPLYDSP